MRQVTSLFAISTLCLLLFACAESKESEPQSAISPEVMSEVAPVQGVMARWAGSCALCHVDGVGGAPKLGVAEEWSPRLAKGKALLLTHTIEGYNNMPPLGYCMSCEEEDFVALIDFMLGESP